MADLAQAGLCPVATTISLIGGKWKPLILRDLLQGPSRYMELKKSVEGVSQKMLTQSLRELEADGIVQREVKPTVPPEVTYSLTELGASMEPVISAMITWGNAYLASPNNKFKNQDE